ncbi:hypothetical protein SAMN05444266_105413 [Chitinophaga jiangningensis]|uniref:Uncharacterized protein n=1 Tax=Chitinophaga jiangningensis TaxID=1419482 RepID=A0A1M7EEJ5_9BACT|nr:hypothetical protein [Chitinophaga jiangningensis]SHL90211.1 hypothetical protein SAMN05444266_105413 [Chitinophaga jiangningensis]
MLPFAIINFHELCPAELCEVTVHKFHTPVEQTAEQVMSYFLLDRQDDGNAPAAADIQHLLFSRMQAEILQVIRKESTILFPVIEKAQENQENIRCIQPNTYQSIRSSYQKITLLLQKLRQVTGNYQLQPSWSNAYKLCIGDMYLLELLVHQWMYVTQNILYPAVTKPGTIMIQQDDLPHSSSID